MPWGAIAAAGMNLVGGMLGADAAQGAAETSANAQVNAAKIAADAAKFRPVGITTNFGQSNFQFDPNGYLTSAGYTLDPRLQGLQEGLLGGYGKQLSSAQGLDTSGLTSGGNAMINLGNKYIATSPEQAASDWLTAQKNLLAPGREQQLAGIRNNLFQSGREGLATGGTSTGMMATNPEMAAYYNSIANQDLGLAANADQYGMNRAQFGQGMLTGGANVLGTGYGLQSQAYSPLMTTLGLGSTIEQLGQSPLDIGAQLGGRSATAGAQVGQSLLYGGLSAAKTAQQGNSYSPWGTALQGAGSAFGNLNWQPTITNYGATGNLAASSSAFDPNANYSGSYNPALGSSSWYD